MDGGNQNQVQDGAFDQDDKRRKLLAEVKETLKSLHADKYAKKDLLKKLNLFTSIELEKTKVELQKEGLAVRKDQVKQEKAKG